MGKLYEEIEPGLAAWITAQPMFFVGTSPLARDGHVNVSPKGHDSLRILGPRQVAYLDLTGSGVETIAHVRENGRIVLMFCAFSGAPKIVRLYGSGRVVTPASADWSELAARFPTYPGTRAIVDVELSRIADSCGYAVPSFGAPTQRDTLLKWVQSKGPDKLPGYRREKNAESIDGLPGLDAEGELGASRSRPRRA